MALRGKVFCLQFFVNSSPKIVLYHKKSNLIKEFNQDYFCHLKTKYLYFYSVMVV